MTTASTWHNERALCNELEQVKFNLMNLNEAGLQGLEMFIRLETSLLAEKNFWNFWLGFNDMISELEAAVLQSQQELSSTVSVMKKLMESGDESHRVSPSQMTQIQGARNCWEAMEKMWAVFRPILAEVIQLRQCLKDLHLQPGKEKTKRMEASLRFFSQCW